MADFENQVAVVTGSTRGIGLAIARCLGLRGARLVLNGTTAEGVRRVVDQFRAEKLVAAGCPADVSTEAGASDLIQTALTEFGRLDILVNDAGIGGTGKFLLDLSIAEWDRLIAVDLRGPFLCCKAALPILLAQGYGKIVNIASVTGIAGREGSTHYSAAKAGLIGFTKALARELAPRGINVNCVAPGLVDTQMSRARGLEVQAASVPWPRIGRPEDIAEAVCYLVSPAAEYVTGQVLSPNGGTYM